MNESVRFAIGFLLLLSIQFLLGGTIFHSIRRWKRVTPAWSWRKAVGAFALLVLIVAVIELIPLVGRYAALVVYLIGLKRISGLDILSTFILACCLGILLFAISAVISTQLHIELLQLRD